MLVLLLLSNMEISNGNKSSSCSLSPIVYQSCNYRLITINQVTGVNQWKPAEQLSQPYFNRVPAGQTMIFRSCCLGSACHLTNALIFPIIFKSVRQLLPYALRLQLSHTSPSKPLPKLPSLLPPLPSLNSRALTQEHEAQSTPGPADSLMHYTTLSTLSPLTVTSPQLPAPSRGQSPTESPACCSDSDMAQTAARCCQTRTEQRSPADAPTSLTFLFCACTAAITHPHHSLSYLPPKCWSSHSKNTNRTHWVTRRTGRKFSGLNAFFIDQHKIYSVIYCLPYFNPYVWITHKKYPKNRRGSTADKKGLKSTLIMHSCNIPQTNSNLLVGQLQLVFKQFTLNEKIL